MTSGSARSLRAVPILLVASAFAGLAAFPAAADEWTTYAYVNDQKDMTVVESSIWIATTGGALRYDTLTDLFVHYPRRIAGGPSSQDLTTVCFLEAEGLVFFGSGDRGVTTYAVADDRWERFEFLPDNRIQNVSCIDDQVFIATAGGFSVRRSEIRTDLCNEIDRGLCCGSDPDTCLFPSFDVRDFDQAGPALWSATAQGPARTDGGEWETETGGLASLDTRSLATFLDDAFVATPGAGGVHRWNGDSGSWVSAATGLPGNRQLGNTVRLVVLPRNDQGDEDLWLATAFGIYKWNGTRWDPAGLGDVNVRSLAAVPTPQGYVYYAATRQGLYRHTAGLEWESIPAPGLPVDIPGQAIDVSGNGVVWIGTITAAMSLTPEGGWTVHRVGQNGIDHSQIFSLFTDSQSRAWLGKCCCRNPPQCPVQFIDDGVASDTLDAWDGWGLGEDGEGRLWIGSNVDGIHVLNPDGSPLTTITTADNLRSASVRALAPSGNKVYIGHEDRGLQILTTNGDPTDKGAYTWRTFGVSEMPDQAVADLALEGGITWVLTSSALQRLQGEVLTPFRLDPDGLPRRGNAVDVDRKGNKWVATNNGVIRLDSGGNISIYNTSNSDLVSDEVLDVAIDPVTGDILFETRIGASRLTPGDPPATGDEAELYAYPNPLHLSGGATVKVGGGSADNALVSDLLGRPVARFEPDVGWDGTRDDGRPLSPGIYIITVNEQTLRLAVIE